MSLRTLGLKATAAYCTTTAGQGTGHRPPPDTMPSWPANPTDAWCRSIREGGIFMKLGICLPHYGKAMEPEGMRIFAESAESLGFDSLWVTDHLIVPKA